MKISLGALFVSLAIAFGVASGATAQQTKHLLIAEPEHGVGSLPLYVAIRKGYFAQEELEVEPMILEGSAHTNAILTKQVFGSISGPEHNAIANERGASLRAIVNVVNRGNIYFVAKPGAEPKPGQSTADYLRGKTIVVGVYGGTPNTILRFMLNKWRLDPIKDVTLHEMATSSILAAMKGGVGDVALVTDPTMSRGIAGKIWSAPFVDIPQELGPYAYSTINVDLSTIKNDRETVAKFVRAMMKGLKFVQTNKTETMEIAKEEFPTLGQPLLEASLDRIYKDQLWSTDGMVSTEGWRTAESVVLQAGILKQSIPFDQVMDMKFVQEATPDK